MQANDTANTVTAKTILMVAPYYPPHTGGLERYAHEVARRVTDTAAWRVVVLTTSATTEEVRETYEGVEVWRLPAQLTLSNTPFSFRWIVDVFRVFRAVKPDLVHVHTPVPGLGDLAAWIMDMNTPLVVTYHAGSMRKGNPRVDWLIWLYEHTSMRVLLWLADHVVCVSDDLRDNFLHRYRFKSSVITPAVDTSRFVPDSSMRSEHPSVVFVAGLNVGDHHKGLERLLAVVVSLKGELPKLTLTVVGEGDARDSFEERVRDLGLSDAVQFRGRLEGEALVRAYRQAWVCALPTENESFGMVLAEAMACGTPVVSTRLGGVPSVVRDGETGLLVAPRDTQAFTDALRTLLTDTTLYARYAAAGRARMEEGFTWEARQEAYEHVYTDVLRVPPTVVHITGYYPPHVGGMEVVAREVALEEARRGSQVEVLTSTCGMGDEPAEIQDERLRVRRLRTWEVAHTPVMWTLPFRLLAQPRGALYHIHLAQALIPEITLLCARLRGGTVVAQFHLDVEPSGTLGALFVWYKQHILPWVLQRIDGVLVFTDAQEDVVVEKHGVLRAKIHHVRNAVADGFFQDRVVREAHTPLRLLALSRLTVQKRVDRLIEALAHISVPVELTVVGDGEDRNELEALATRVAPDRVRFVGTKSHEEIREYHAWADVFVIPSDKEGGMPLTALEAMAAGLPVIGSGVIGVQELVEGVGVVVTDPNPHTFAAAITELCEHPERLEGLSKASAACAREHTWARAVDTIEASYKATLHDYA